MKTQHRPPAIPSESAYSSKLEKCLALTRRAEQAKSQFFPKRSKVRKSNHAFLPEGIQIKDLTKASLVSQLTPLAGLHNIITM